MTMISEACGTPTSLIPLSTSTNAKAKRALRNPDRHLASQEHAGNRADEEPPHRVRVDVAVQEMAHPGDPEKRGRVEDVRADDLLGRQREQEQHREPEERS